MNTDVNIETIERIVCEQFTILPEHLRLASEPSGQAGHPKASFDVTDARHFLWFVLSSVMGCEAAAIAKEYGVTKRAVFSAVKKIKESIRTQPFYARNYRAIQEKIKELNIL